MKWRVLLVSSVLSVAGCSEPTLGDLPALCSADGACPDGYDCIHGVCALPGTPVPITVGQTGPLMRGTDVRMVPQAQSVLVAWQSYPYFAEGEKVVGARVAPDGTVSQRMDLVGKFVAESDSLEPYFDVLAGNGDRVLVSISAPSLADDPSVKPRLITYRVDLPPEGKENSPPSFQAAWGMEQRLDTVGYGAVSLPKLANHDANTVDVGYVRSRTTPTDTVADLAIFAMQPDGTLKSNDAIYHSVRDKLSVAVGVFDAFRFATGTWWVLDDERPSALYLLDAGAEIEAPLAHLAVPVAVDGSSLLYISPSARQGDKLATSPVSGAAELRKVSVVDAAGMLQTSEVTLGKLPVIRDNPRPSWVAREGKPALLVTPGEDPFSTNILVYTVDPQTGASNLVQQIQRFSTRLIRSVNALLVGDKLFVAWLEADTETGAVRMAILPEP